MQTTKETKIILGFIAGLLCFSETYSQSFNSKGTTELGGTILFSSHTTDSNDPRYYDETNDAINTLAFNIYVGKMLIDGFELGFVPSYVSVSEGNSSSSVLGLYLAPAAVFQTKGTAYPFMQAMFGYNKLQASYGSSVEEGYGLGVSGGVKIVLRTSGLMLIEFQYMGHHFEDSNTFNTLSFGIGFRVFILKQSEEKK